MLTVDRILGITVEVCKAITELVILTAFSVALVFWAIKLFAPTIIVWGF